MERHIEEIVETEEWRTVDPAEVDVNFAPLRSERKILLWALVLEARYLPCRIETGEGDLRLLVPEHCLDDALNELRLFEEENRNWPPPPPSSRPLVENTLSTLSVLLLLATFHNLTRLDLSPFGYSNPDWTALGSADAGMIVDGQWWRLVTSLTLHSDSLHLIANLTIGGFFVVSLCREFGSGLAWSLLLGSGILGNLVNAWLHPSSHTSIGASTAVFGSVGILAAITMTRYRHHRRRRRMIPLAAALALLAELGTAGKNTDLGAHLFGFLFGLLLGLGAEYLVGREGRPNRRVNGLLALLSAVIVVAAWWRALSFKV